MQSVSGPMKVAGAYQFTTRLDGVTSVVERDEGRIAREAAAARPELRCPSTKRRHFFTPFDLMTFGFNPVLPAYPVAGRRRGRPIRTAATSRSTASRARRAIVGIQKVKVPAGTFDALVVSSTLTQPGFKFGSGTRTMWFAPGKGLVKLVFRHGDGSTSIVELLK